jgi:hypothetical protein
MIPKTTLLLILVFLVACAASQPTAETLPPTAPATNQPEQTTAVSIPTTAPLVNELQPTATLFSEVATAEGIPTEQATPTEVLTALPTLAETAVPIAATPAEPVITAGRTAEGAYFRGSLDAPITMIDYSDFL